MAEVGGALAASPAGVTVTAQHGPPTRAGATSPWGASRAVSRSHSWRPRRKPALPDLSRVRADLPDPFLTQLG